MKDDQPLFELIWADELDALIQPSIRYIFAQTAYRWPRQFLWLFNRFDEFYAVLQTIVQASFIRDCKASFSEHFYGIQRINSGLVKRYDYSLLTLLV